MRYFDLVQIESDNPISLLSVPQVETMRHVYEQKNSKQIARLMDVSPHTVDERVRKVLKKLNVASRIEAAQLLADRGAFDYAIPQPPLRYQLLNGGTGIQQQNPQHDTVRRFFDIGAPFPTASQPVNRHRGMERIIWPILIAFATVLAFSGLYSILAGLSQVAR